MEKYQILEHKADVKIKVFGRTKEELFLNALKGMNYILKPEVEKGFCKKREIKIESLNLDTLLVDFLSEILYLTQVNRETYEDIKFKEFTNNKIEGELRGRKIKRLGEDIKGVTYHNLKIQKKENFWTTTILFDI